MAVKGRGPYSSYEEILDDDSNNKLIDMNRNLITCIHSVYPFVQVSIDPDPEGNYVIDAKWYYKNKPFRWRSRTSCGFLRSGHDDLELNYIMRELFNRIQSSAISMIGDELEKGE